MISPPIVGPTAEPTVVRIEATPIIMPVLSYGTCCSTILNISGTQLNDAFQSHVQVMELEITEQMVNSIVPVSGHYALMAGSEFYEAQTVILTTGAASMAALPGEEAFLGRGVSCCAACDGNLYRGRTIAVVCSGARFEEEVRFLASMAEKVYYFPS